MTPAWPPKLKLLSAKAKTRLVIAMSSISVRSTVSETSRSSYPWNVHPLEELHPSRLIHSPTRRTMRVDRVQRMTESGPTE